MAKHLGLTLAAELGLKHVRGDDVSAPTEATYRRMYEAGLTTPGGGQLTPRGHAALAAPRMTQMQFDILCLLESGRADEIPKAWVNSFSACCYKGWIDKGGDDLTLVGLTALNNVRAAMGDAAWKP